jgi:acetate kinase
MNVFVLNCGSSSVKFQIVNTDLDLFEDDLDHVVAKGLIEKVGSKEAIFKFEAEGNEPVQGKEPLLDHKEAIQRIRKWMESPETKISGVLGWNDIHAIGHRVVHGGEQFTKSVLIGPEVLKKVEECTELAPLHNPANLKGIAACTEIFPSTIPQVAIFDTAYHCTMPEEAYLYAIPYEFYEKYKVRSYGFHGTSHRYIAYRYRKITDTPKDKVDIVSLHLGNGSSICAIKNGHSTFNSMGMTPLEGLIMGTRCGDIDPGVIEFLYSKGVGDLPAIMNILQKKSGMLGISGISNDMRDIEKAAKDGNHRALIALKMYAFRTKRYIGSCLAEMGGADAIVFTAGIGENDVIIREMICEGLESLGIELDYHLNKQAFKGKCMKISKEKSPMDIYVIPTNEELLLARDAVRVVRDAPREW